MTIVLAQIAAALVLLWVGGEALVRGASAVASRAGISPLAIGLTVVAFGTSAPELAVSLDAALAGADDISVGNVVGSNIANVALILGLAALLRPAVVEAKVVRLDAPIMAAVSLALLAVLADREASRLEGGLLVAGLGAYLGLTFWQARRESRRVRREFASAAPSTAIRAPLSALMIVAGLGLLVAGGHLLVAAAVELAGSLGLSQAAIGLTVVAVGTSLPELATSVVATVRGQGDIAVGNVVGSNIFNILGILGTTALVRPLATGGLSPFDLGAMVVLALVLVPLLWTRLRLGRMEGAVLLAGFIYYLIRLLSGSQPV